MLVSDAEQLAVLRDSLTVRAAASPPNVTGGSYGYRMQTRRIFRDGHLERTTMGTTELSSLVRDPNSNCWGWLDLTHEDAAMIEKLARKLDLHELAVEDAFSEHERPKIMRYNSHMLLTVTESNVDEREGEVALSRLTAFIMPRLIVTVRDDEFPIERVEKRVADNDDLAEHGVAFILWALLDVLVDDHIATLARLDDITEDLSRELFEEDGDMIDLQRRAFGFRRSIARMRHATIPLREVVTTLVRRDTQLVPPELQPYFADVYDHTLHAADWTESLRDQISNVLETNVALQGNRMNLIMKQVTSWAAIIAVPTAITGFFGQNLEFLGFGTQWGAWMSVGLIVVSSLALWLTFKKQDWL